MVKQKDYGLQGANKLQPKSDDGDKGLNGAGGLRPKPSDEAGENKQ